MKYFEKMVFAARTTKIFDLCGEGIFKDADKPDKFKSADSFFSLVEKCSVLVVNDKTIGISDEFNWLANDNYIPARLDLPFPTSSFELLNRPIVVKTVDRNVNFYCWLVNELSPKEYEFYSYAETSVGPVIAYSDSKSEFGQLGKRHLEVFLNEISRCKSGVEEVNHKIKIGSGSNKRTHIIRTIVHISPKKNYQETESIGSEKIDWSHRWSVRGHWRKIDGLGKNRDEKYSISGFTWVKDHVKGPEGMPFVKKVRYVDSVIERRA